MLRLAQRLSPVIQPACLILAFCIPVSVTHAQSQEALDNLIFDPLLLDAGASSVVIADTVASRPTRSAGLALTFSNPGATANQQTELPEGMALDMEAYQRAVLNLERSEGQFAPGLIQHLISLGDLHQARNEHGQAIALFERADHISRVNNGLYHPEQFFIIERLIESYMAEDNFSAANDNQRYLLFLNSKLSATESFSMVSSLAGLGDNSMETFGQALLEYDENKSGLQINMLNSLSGIPDVDDPARDFAISNLVRAKNIYLEAITTLLENREYFHPQMLELEYKFLETLFLFGYRFELVRDPHYYLTFARRDANMANRWTFLRRNTAGYQSGQDTFERISQYLENDPAATSLQRVTALIEYGDWYLLFNRPNAAVRQYATAHALATELALEPARIQSLFNPNFPVQLPLFTAKPNSREKFAVSREVALNYDGYIDMSFSINRNGTARKFAILDKSSNTTLPVEQRLKLYLKNSPFRPRIVGGEVETREDVRMRYYYTFLQ